MIAGVQVKKTSCLSKSPKYFQIVSLRSDLEDFFDLERRRHEELLAILFTLKESAEFWELDVKKKFEEAKP